MFDKVYDGPCGVAGVLVLQYGKVRFVKDRKKMVLGGRVDGPVLIVQPYLIRVFLEDSLLLRGGSPCWDMRREARVRREDEGGSGYM